MKGFAFCCLCLVARAHALPTGSSFAFEQQQQQQHELYQVHEHPASNQRGVLSGRSKGPSLLTKTKRVRSTSALECFAVSGNVHVLRWTGGGDDLSGCQAYASSLTSALAECPSNKNSKGITCLVAGGDAIISPLDADSCNEAAGSVHRGVRLYASHDDVYPVSCMLGVLRYKSASDCAASVPHINDMAVNGFPACRSE